MRHNESALPLTVSVLLTVALHAGLASKPAAEMWGWGGADSDEPTADPEGAKDKKVKDKPDPRKPRPPEDPPLGTPTDPERATVAFLSYEAFEEMKAKRSRTLQPAMQRVVDPVTQAVPRLDPTPPAAVPSVVAVAAVVPPVVVPQTTPPRPPVPPVPPLPPVPRREMVDVVGPQPPPVPPTPPVQEMPPPVVAVATAAPAAASEASPRPTSAARTESEALPRVIELDSPEVRVGRVLVSNGLEIHPVMPAFEGPTLASAWPSNPRVRLTFNPDGKVRDAKLLDSSGYPAVDAPVLASLYRWTMTPESIEKAGGGPVTIPQITLIFHD